jgi:hypothetical protein
MPHVEMKMLDPSVQVIKLCGNQGASIVKKGVCLFAAGSSQRHCGRINTAPLP